MGNKLLTLLILATLLLGFSCSENAIAGGNGSETGNPIVVGEVSLPAGHVSDSLSIFVRKQDSDVGSQTFSYLGDEFKQNGELVVATGTFDFTLNEAGTYVVEIRSGDTLAAIQYVTVTDDRTYELQKMVLDTLRHITGTVKLFGGESSDITIYALGTERMTVAQSDGSFTLAVPAGLISLKLVTDSDEYAPVEIPFVQSGTSIGEVKILAIEPVSNDYECDSLIMRAILDSNALFSVAVEQVTVKANGRIVEFDVAADTTQPELITISGFITVIPSVIGGLSALEELEIQYTGLTSLPEAIGKLVTLKELELNNNNLTSLPVSIINLTPTGELRLSGNALVLNEEQTIWANTYDPDWASKQQL